MDNHISIYQKNTKTLAVLVTGINDLSTYIPYLSVKKKATDVSTVLFKSGIVSDPSSTFTITLTTTDTSLAPLDYVYDLTIKGNGNVITIVRDKFTIMENIIEI
jgi:hypothetical protein